VGASVGRTLVGTVVDAAGRPVADAKVVYASGAMFEGGERLRGRSTVSSEDGSFSVADVPLESMRGPLPFGIAADHPLHGRSMPVLVPDGECPPFTLVLRPVGSIAGRIVRGGRPLEHTIVGIGWPELTAPPVEGNTFVASDVPAGKVDILTHPMDSITHAHWTTVEVVAGTRVDIEIEIPVGTRALVVNLQPQAGAEVAGASVYLFAGTVTIERQRQVAHTLFVRSRGIERWRASNATPVRFKELTPGDYTLCVLPLDGDPNDGRFLRRVQEEGADLRVYCTPIFIEPEPSEQTIAIELPAPQPVPAS
jgi:hypothetical protein